MQHLDCSALPQVPCRWLGEKDYARVMKLLQKEIEQQRRTFTKEELSDAYESYTNDRERQLQELQVGREGQRPRHRHTQANKPQGSYCSCC